MIIATFNIYNVNKRLLNLLAWLTESQPNVVCLQELKADDRTFPEGAILESGYQSVWRGRRTRNGVAILARGAEPILTCKGLPAMPSDTKANGVLIASIYLPDGNPNSGPKFEYKLAWFDGLIERAALLMNANAPAALAGDFNVVPTKADIYQPNHWRGDAPGRSESAFGIPSFAAAGLD